MCLWWQWIQLCFCGAFRENLCADKLLQLFVIFRAKLWLSSAPLFLTWLCLASPHVSNTPPSETLWLTCLTETLIIYKKSKSKRGKFVCAVFDWRFSSFVNVLMGQSRIWRHDEAGLLLLWFNVITSLSVQDADVTCCLIRSCAATVPMATPSSSQRAAAAAAASCRAEVCAVNVAQLSQLGAEHWCLTPFIHSAARCFPVYTTEKTQPCWNMVYCTYPTQSSPFSEDGNTLH